MSDLISRSALINKIRGIVPSSQDVDFIVRLIDEQPTAYNPEKVVTELKEISDYILYNIFQRDGSLYIQNAVEIVRKGGVE